MLKKTLTTVLALMLAPTLVLAGNGPNPGGINPGSQLWQGGTLSAGIGGPELTACFSFQDWCDTVQESVGTPTFCTEGDPVCVAEAQAQAWTGCLAGARASAFLDGGVGGEVDFEIWRHGNNGAVHHINFGGGAGGGFYMAVEAMAGTGAGAIAGQFDGSFCEGTLAECANYDGAVYARGRNETEVCEEVDDWEDSPFADFCAYVLGRGEATSDAIAYALAGAVGGASITAEGGGDAIGSNEVFAANIEYYAATMGVGLSGFVAADASAMVDVYATAYMNAYVNLATEACVEAGEVNTGTSDLPWEAACDEDDAEAIATASALATAYGERMAAAMAGLQVDLFFGVEYQNLPGPADEDLLNLIDSPTVGGVTVEASCIAD